jgi:hypothetical protein
MPDNSPKMAIQSACRGADDLVMTNGAAEA